MAETIETPITVDVRVPKTTPKLNAALAKAQGDFVQPEKNKTQKIKDRDGKLLYETKYADLKNIIEAFRPHLAKNGLSFRQKTTKFKDGWRLVLILSHETGETDQTTMPINLNQAPQQLGGLLTYLKRYQAAAYFGIAADDDDDGTAAQGKDVVAETNDSKGKGSRPDPKGKPANSKPASRPATKPAAEQVPDQSHPPDDVPSLTADGEIIENFSVKPSKDPADFVFPEGFGDVTGKTVGSIGEQRLRKVMAWCLAGTKVDPKPRNLGDLIIAMSKIKAFFDSVGVS